MGEYTESEMKVVVKIVNEMLRGHIDDLGRTIVDMEQRIIRMERAFDALGRRLEGSERHVEDEGWFD
jgi:hypothetical protein